MKRAASRSRRTKQRIVLLGSQSARHDVLSATIAELEPTGPVATIRAGWQEMESEPGAVSEVLGERAVPLDLHARAERVWREDPELMDAHRTMQREARILRRAYNLRLSAMMDAWDALGRQSGPEHLLDPEREAALEAIRHLDERQRRRIGELRENFAASLDLASRPAVQRERDEVEALLAETPTVIVDGGHVAVLVNRLRLFGLDGLLGTKTLVGIAGGAMVLTERLVLFHDSPPWGPGHAEVAESGLGLAPDVVVLPHAARRLQLDDPVRVARLSQRFAPAECLGLEAGSRIEFDGKRWSTSRVSRLTSTGEVVGEVAA